MINVTYPEFLANTLKLNHEDFEHEIKVSALVKLYELGKLSSGVAAKVLGISRLDFLELLHLYQVSVIGNNDVNDIQEDYNNA